MPEQRGRGGQDDLAYKSRTDSQTNPAAMVSEDEGNMVALGEDGKLFILDLGSLLPTAPCAVFDWDRLCLTDNLIPTSGTLTADPDNSGDVTCEWDGEDLLVTVPAGNDIPSVMGFGPMGTWYISDSGPHPSPFVVGNPDSGLCMGGPAETVAVGVYEVKLTMDDPYEPANGALLVSVSWEPDDGWGDTELTDQDGSSFSFGVCQAKSEQEFLAEGMVRTDTRDGRWMVYAMTFMIAESGGVTMLTGSCSILSPAIVKHSPRTSRSERTAVAGGSDTPEGAMASEQAASVARVVDAVRRYHPLLNAGPEGVEAFKSLSIFSPGPQGEPSDYEATTAFVADVCAT